MEIHKCAATELFSQTNHEDFISTILSAGYCYYDWNHPVSQYKHGAPYIQIALSTVSENRNLNRDVILTACVPLDVDFRLTPELILEKFSMELNISQND
jgi:hypothetical protein